MERKSADAERDSKDVKLYAFLNAQLQSGHPQRYPALVTDLRNFGFFVDVTGLGMSGLVPFSELEDDFYLFDAGRLLVVGRRSRRIIRMGDQLEVQVANVDRFKKRVDFRLAPAEPARFSRQTRPTPPAQGGKKRGPAPFERPVPQRPRPKSGSLRRRLDPARPAATTEETWQSTQSGRPNLKSSRQSDRQRPPVRLGRGRGSQNRALNPKRARRIPK